VSERRERAVVVGAGGIAGAWFPALIKEQVEIPAVVDLRLEAAKRRIEHYQLDAEASADLKSVLKRMKPDFVVDLTVPEAHCEVTCTALEAGCHVIGEKPMASSMAEARRMVETSERTGKLYMVSQSRRWDLQHDMVRRTLSSGVLGRVTTINCDFYIGAHFGGFRDEMPSPLILDMAIHHFDLARYMTGVDPEAVYAKEFNPVGSWYRGDASASCIFEMTGGVIFTYRGSWCSEGFHTSWNGDWRIVCEKGTLVYAQDRTPVARVVASHSGFDRRMKKVEAAASPMTAGGMHGALLEMLAYLRTGELPQTECHDNIKSLAMVFGVIESSREGKRVALSAG